MVKTKIKKKINKINIDNVTNKQLLEENKKNRNKLVTKINKEKTIKEKKEKNKEWWQKPIDKNKFIIKEIKNKFYAHYEEWKPNIFIGPYGSKKDVEDILIDYIKESKKPTLERKLQNIHSIILNL